MLFNFFSKKTYWIFLKFHQLKTLQISRSDRVAYCFQSLEKHHGNYDKSTSVIGKICIPSYSMENNLLLSHFFMLFIYINKSSTVPTFTLNELISLMNFIKYGSDQDNGRFLTGRWRFYLLKNGLLYLLLKARLYWKA